MNRLPRYSFGLLACWSVLCLSAFATAQEVAISELPQAPAPQQSNASPPVVSEKNQGGFFSNYGSFSVNDTLPPQTAGEKFKMAIKDDFGPSTFVIRAAVAGGDRSEERRGGQKWRTR